MDKNFKKFVTVIWFVSGAISTFVLSYTLVDFLFQDTEVNVTKMILKYSLGISILSWITWGALVDD